MMIYEKVLSCIPEEQRPVKSNGNIYIGSNLMMFRAGSQEAAYGLIRQHSDITLADIFIAIHDVKRGRLEPTRGGLVIDKIYEIYKVGRTYFFYSRKSHKLWFDENPRNGILKFEDLSVKSPDAVAFYKKVANIFNPENDTEAPSWLELKSIIYQNSNAIDRDFLSTAIRGRPCSAVFYEDDTVRLYPQIMRDGERHSAPYFTLAKAPNGCLVILDQDRETVRIVEDIHSELRSIFP